MGLRNRWLAVIGVLLISRAQLFSKGATVGVQISEPARSTDLNSLVQEARDRNPEIQAARRAVEAKRARIPQARAWPDPMVTVGYGGNLLPPYTLMRADPSSARQFMAVQEIPYPGKTRLRGQIATRDADAEALNYEAVSRRVAAQVKQAYFDLYFTDQSLATLRKDRELLEKFAKISEIRYSVGKAAQQDVLKAQVELSRLKERETVLEQGRHTLQAQLNSLRNLPPDTPLGSTAEARPSVLAHSLDELEKAAEASFPELRRARTMVEANRLGVSLAEKEVHPNFSLGYTYMQRTGRFFPKL